MQGRALTFGNDAHVRPARTLARTFGCQDDQRTIRARSIVSNREMNGDAPATQRHRRSCRAAEGLELAPGLQESNTQKHVSEPSILCRTSLTAAVCSRRSPDMCNRMSAAVQHLTKRLALLQVQRGAMLLPGVAALGGCAEGARPVLGGCAVGARPVLGGFAVLEGACAPLAGACAACVGGCTAGLEAALVGGCAALFPAAGGCAQSRTHTHARPLSRLRCILRSPSSKAEAGPKCSRDAPSSRKARTEEYFARSR